jgi:hypothetical protein
MKIARPVLQIAASGITAAAGFVGLLTFIQTKGQELVPLWRDLVGLACFGLMVIGLVGFLASFISWIVSEISMRRKARDAS